MLHVRIAPDTVNTAVEHARAIVRAQTARPVGAYSTPFVPNAHAAQFPHCCPTCGTTVWSFVDKYDVRCELCQIRDDDDD